MTSGVCLPCLTFVAFPLDRGDLRAARREASELAPVMWEEGLELATMLALENAKRDGVPHAQDALDDISRNGARVGRRRRDPLAARRRDGRGHPPAAGGASERSERGDRPHRLAGHLGNDLEVAVVVQHRQLRELGCGRDEQVRCRNASVMERSRCGERLEYVRRTSPDTPADRYVAQSLEVSSHGRERGMIAGAPKELQSNHRAGRDRAGDETRIEVGRDRRVFDAVRPRARVGELDQSPQNSWRASSSISEKSYSVSRRSFSRRTTSSSAR